MNTSRELTLNERIREAGIVINPGTLADQLRRTADDIDDAEPNAETERAIFTHAAEVLERIGQDEQFAVAGMVADPLRLNSRVIEKKFVAPVPQEIRNQVIDLVLEMIGSQTQRNYQAHTLGKHPATAKEEAKSAGQLGQIARIDVAAAMQKRKIDRLLGRTVDDKLFGDVRDLEDEAA